MGEIFISHSSDDNAAVEDIVTRLRDVGYGSLYVDFDPEVGIPAGRLWEHELYRSLRQCRALLAVCTKSWLRSKWCFAELTQARALGKAIFMVRIDDCEIPAFAMDVQAVDLRKDVETGIASLLRGLTDTGIDPLQEGELRVVDRAPYPGFDAFQESDSAVYFGREKEIQQSLELLRTMREFGWDQTAPRILLVLGASGAGKSSLVRAGLLPRLKRDPDRWFVLPPIRPGNTPIEALIESLSNAGLTSDSMQSILDGLSHTTSDRPTSSSAAMRLAANASTDDATPVLFIDQLEEVLGTTAAPQAELFLGTVGQFLRDTTARPILVATLRSDALAYFQNSPLLQDLVTVDVKLGQLSPKQLTSAILSPAQKAGLDFAPELASRMLADLETPDALPILAFTLREMYDQREKKSAIKEDDYVRVGEIHGAVEKRLTDILRLQNLTEEREDQLRDFFLALVQINPEGKLSRRPVSWSSVPVELQATLARLTDARLLVDRELGDERRIDVAHESLFRVWPKLSHWITENLEFLAWRERLRRAVWEWQLLGETEDALLPYAALPAAEHWLSVRSDSLDETERAFIVSSRSRLERRLSEESAKRQRELEQERALRVAEQTARREAERSAAIQAESANKLEKAAQQLRAQLAESYWIAAERARERNSLFEAAHWLARAAATENDANRLANIRLAIDVLTQAPRLMVLTEGFEAIQGLAENVIPSLPPRAALFRDGAAVLSWLPGDNTIQGRGVARLTDARTCEPLGADMVHEDWIAGLRLSTSGRTILTWGGLAIEGQAQEAKVRLWDATSGAPIGAPMVHGAWVLGAVFNDDESLILSHAEDGTACVWDAQSGRIISRIRHECIVVHAAFLDNTQLLSIEANGNAWTSNLDYLRSEEVKPQHQIPDADWRALIPIGAWEKDVIRLSIDTPMLHQKANVFVEIGDKLGAAVGPNGVLSPDGKHAITWGEGEEPHLIDLEQDSTTELEFDEESSVDGALFCDDGSRALAWSTKTQSDTVLVRVWDIPSGEAMHRKLDQWWLTKSSFSPSGQYIVTWETDSSIMISNSDTGIIGARSISHPGKLDGFVFSPDERTLVTWSRASVWVWNIDRGTLRFGPIHHPGTVYEASLDPSGGKLLTCSDDGAVRVWTLEASNRQRFDVVGQVAKAGFSNNRHQVLLCQSEEQTRGISVQAWDLGSGLPASPIMRHDESDNSYSLVGHPALGAIFGREHTRVLSWSKDNTARLWDAQTGAPVVPPMRHDKQIWHARFFADDTRILTWSYDGTARIWDSDSGHESAATMQHTKDVRGAILDSTEQRVLTFSVDGTARIWNTSTGKLETQLLKHDDEIYGACLSPDERKILTWSKDASARLWDARDGSALVPPMRDNDRVWGACFDAQGERILSWSHFASGWGRRAGGVFLWNAADGKQLIEPVPHKAGVAGATFFADDTRILSWSEDNTARITDAMSGLLVGEPLEHRDEVVGALLTRDEERVLTWSTDGTARLWNTVDGSPSTLPMGHEAKIDGAEFSEDETRILTWGGGQARLWSAQDAALIAQPLRLSGDYAVASFCLDDTAILAWGGEYGGPDAVLWRLGSNEIASVGDLETQVSVATGTAMDAHGNLSFLSCERWLNQRPAA